MTAERPSFVRLHQTARTPYDFGTGGESLARRIRDRPDASFAVHVSFLGVLMVRWIVMTVVMGIVPCSVWGQSGRDPFVDHVFSPEARNAAIPLPASVLGHGLATRFASLEGAYAYAEAVASASPRCLSKRYGTTITGRSLLTVTVSSPENLARLPEIHRAARALQDGRAAIPDDLPVCVWFGMSIHGDEGSGVDAGLALLYHLASSETEATRALLANAVLVLDVCQNPDGRARFVAGVEDRQSFPRDDAPFSTDNTQPWPGARTNHYLFDLNRDWFLQTQQETRARVREVLAAVPQVLGDFHEMGSDHAYYFSTPPSDPINPHISEHIRGGWRLLGDGVTKAFDARGLAYWTADVFPANYPGYGGSWPCFLGTVGITYEQASSRGGRVRRNDGTLLTLFDAASHHCVAAYATLATAAKHRGPMLTQYRDHFASVTEAGARDGEPWFVFTPRHDPHRVTMLRELMDRNGIVTQVATDAVTLSARPLMGEDAHTMTVPKGSVFVSTRQPSRPLILALLDPAAPLPESLVLAEKQRHQCGEPSELYDVTAWNLPLLFGVESFRAARVPAGFDASPRDARSTPSATTTRPVAWVFPGQGIETALLLEQLQENGVRVRVVPYEFSIGDRSFTKGALLAQADRQEPTGLEFLKSLESSERCQPIATYRVTNGKDLGSQRTLPIVRSEIVVAGGRGTDPYAFGATRWFLEQVAGLPVVTVPLEGDFDAALKTANVLVLPDGTYEDVGRPSKKSLDGFLARGGVIVATRGAVRLLARKEIGLLDLVPVKDSADLGRVPGPIVEGHVAQDHWLCHGLEERVHFQCRTPVFDSPPAKPFKVAIRHGDEGALLCSGFLVEAQQKGLAGAPVVFEGPVGGGRVIAFTEDFVFRGAHPGLFKVFLNAVQLGPTHTR